MPTFEETENEYRYRIRAPDAFTPGSFRQNRMQKAPEINSVVGRIRGEDVTTPQSIRFSKEIWTLEAAKKWITEHKEELLKTATDDIEFLKKGNLEVQALQFTEKDFTEASVKNWLVAKDIDTANLKKSAGVFSIKIQDESNFLKGSIRDIKLRDGLVATVGLLKKEFKKAITKRVPDRFTLNVDSIYELQDIDVTEVTLTRSPVVGKMSEFLIMKSADAGDFSDVVPLTKVDEEKRQVGGYVLVPDLPDFQGDMVSAKEVEKAAHKFMQNLSDRCHRGSATGHEHQQFDGVGYPIESFVDHEGQHGTPGGWFLNTQILEDEIWKSIKTGEIIGYSIGGNGTRKKASVIIDHPEPIAKSDEGILRKFMTWLKGQEVDKALLKPSAIVVASKPGQPPVALTEAEQRLKEEAEKKLKEEAKRRLQNLGTENKLEVDKMAEDKQLKLLKKFDLPLSKIKELQEAGVDLEKAYEGVEMLTKAVGMNFSLQGLGATTIKLADVLRNGEFGSFPQNTSSSFGSSVSKSEGKTDVTKSEEGADVKELRELVGQMTTQIDVLNKSRGIRKSTESAPPVQVQTKPETNDDDKGWDSMDAMDLSAHEAAEVAKSMGLENMHS